MSYIFITRKAKITINTGDSEEWGVANVEGAGAASVSAALKDNYGVMGNTIDLASVTAGDIDAALKSMGRAYTVKLTDGSTAISYPSGIQ